MRTRMTAVVVVVWVLVALVRAQSQQGDIAGTVTDESGVALPGVTITLTGQERRTAVAGPRGEFLFQKLLPGAYEVRAALSGFVTKVERVEVAPGRTARVAVRLAVSAAAETVTVTGQESRSLDASTGIASGVGGGVGGGVWLAGPPPRAAAPVAVAGGNYLPGRYTGPFNTEAYDHIDENGLRRVATDPLSTFSIDVDTASYANVRRFLAEGAIPPAGAVHIEEMVNYFRFEYPQPRGEVPFSITTELSECPWNPKHRLALVGIQGREIDDSEPAPRNLVFLIDVSGSMQPPDKLPLVPPERDR